MARRLSRRTRFASPFVLVLGCAKPPEQPAPAPIVAAAPRDVVNPTVTYPPDFASPHRDFDSEPDAIASDAGVRTDWRPCSERHDPTINCNPPRPSAAPFVELRVIGQTKRSDGALEVVLAIPEGTQLVAYAANGVFVEGSKLLAVTIEVIEQTRNTAQGVVRGIDRVPSDRVRLSRKPE
ncbi:MAG: hypothetical protein ABI867_12775 [Kofleriaceae bacterium]